MGGNAFTLTHNLYTPRMPPDVYHTVLSRAHAQLCTVFDKVESPIEAPAKKDYGDIDFLVLLKDGTKPPSVEQVAKLLGAEYYTNESGGAAVNYAVRWPDDGDDLTDQVDALGNSVHSMSIKAADNQDEESDAAVSTPNTEPGTKSKLRHIQIDVHTCSNVQIFDFTLFMHAHGDLWSILGTVIRPYGLTCTQQSGLTIRIPELESQNKSLARFTLTHDRDTVLRYLGLDVARYQSRFDTWHDLMAYICTSRFFGSKKPRSQTDTASTKHDHSDQVQHANPDSDRAAPKLTSHDRRKSVQRPLFRYWLDVYLPTHPDLPTGSASHLTRAQVIDDAKSFFGRDLSAAFDQYRAHHVQAMTADRTWSDIRKALPCAGSDLTFAMKGLRFEIVEDVATKDLTEFNEVQWAWFEGRYHEVKEWARGNWEEVKERQVERMREKSSGKLREHRENERRRQEAEAEGEGEKVVP